jgi:hypothetical protein
MVHGALMLANYLFPCLNDLFLGIKKAPKGAHPKVSPNRVSSDVLAPNK